MPTLTGVEIDSDRGSATRSTGLVAERPASHPDHGAATHLRGSHAVRGDPRHRATPRNLRAMAIDDKDLEEAQRPLRRADRRARTTRGASPTPGSRSSRSTRRTTSPTTSTSGSASPASSPSPAASHREMYRKQLWTMRQYAGYASAKESNERYSTCSTHGSHRPVDGLRPADPARPGLRRPALPRRGRPHRRRDRHARRHADRVRRHPARRGLDVDDHQRARRGAAAALRARRRGAGRRRPRSCAAPSRTTSSRSTSPAGTSSTRPSRRCG